MKHHDVTLGALEHTSAILNPMQYRSCMEDMVNPQVSQVARRRRIPLLAITTRKVSGYGQKLARPLLIKEGLKSLLQRISEESEVPISQPTSSLSRDG